MNKSGIRNRGRFCPVLIRLEFENRIFPFFIHPPRQMAILSARRLSNFWQDIMKFGYGIHMYNYILEPKTYCHYSAYIVLVSVSLGKSVLVKSASPSRVISTASSPCAISQRQVALD
jgi:hypothetical protein